MMMPSIFGKDLFDDFFEFPFGSNGTNHLMKTDIEDQPEGYTITMDIPGVKKEDVKAELKDGYLTIQATANTNKDEKDEKGKYVRRERYFGSSSRSFYVGDRVQKEDIHPKFENGILSFAIPKEKK